MEEQQLHRRVREIYEEINNKWLRFHFHLLVLCTLVVAVFEILIFLVILKTDMLNCTLGTYWMKYIVTPVGLSSLIACIGYLVITVKKTSVAFKQYGVSFLFALFAFVLSLAHSGFVAILVCGVFPVLITIIYENQRLTGIIAFSGMIFQFISGYSIFWDREKIVDHSYLINMIILMVAVISTWIICALMIKFMKMKREIVITNDIERYRLQERVNIDGLTNVGNKFALIKRFGEASVYENKICYLAMVDVDDFKKINDSYGHQFGDEVLRCIGDAMNEMKEGTEAFRYGGDEFCVLFAEESLDKVILEVEGIQKYLQTNIEMVNGEERIFISTGIACYSNEKTWMEFLKQADEALYEAKKKHGTQISVFKG